MQLVDEGLRRRFVERLLFASLRPVEQRAVLRDDAFEQVEARKDRLQVVELAAGDEHQLAARLAQALERGERGLVDAAMMSDGAVVVAAQREIAHAVEVLGVRGAVL